MAAGAIESPRAAQTIGDDDKDRLTINSPLEGDSVTIVDDTADAATHVLILASDTRHAQSRAASFPSGPLALRIKVGAEAEDIGDHVSHLFGREDGVRHFRMRRRKQSAQSGRGQAAGVCDVAES